MQQATPDFRKMELWQKSRHLTAILMMATTAPARGSVPDSALAEQIQKHCVSILTQIFEAFQQTETPHRQRHFDNALLLLESLRAQLEHARVENLFDHPMANSLLHEIRELSALIPTQSQAS